MAYTQPTVPNVVDYITFLQNELQIPATALPYPLGSPAAPALAAGSGGSLPSETVYVKVTYVSQYGESTPSAQSSIGVTGPSGQVTVTGPAAVQNATGWNVYASSTTGVEVLQNVTPIAIGTTSYAINALTTGTVSPPAADGTGSPWIGYAFNASLNLTLVVPTVAAQDYVNVVYCGAAHTQLFITPDLVNQQYFKNLRDSFNMLKPANGLVTQAADQGTSSTTVVPDTMKRLNFADLQFITTPWGRWWLGWGQDYGTPWGLS